MTLLHTNITIPYIKFFGASLAPISNSNNFSGITFQTDKQEYFCKRTWGLCDIAKGFVFWDKADTLLIWNRDRGTNVYCRQNWRILSGGWIICVSHPGYLNPAAVCSAKTEIILWPDHREQQPYWHNQQCAAPPTNWSRRNYITDKNQGQRVPSGFGPYWDKFRYWEKKSVDFAGRQGVAGG